MIINSECIRPVKDQQLRLKFLRLLLNPGMDAINKKRSYSTPSMLALDKSDLETIELMITNNLHVNNSGWSGRSTYGN